MLWTAKKTFTNVQLAKNALPGDLPVLNPSA